jgi:hypothetical protein
LEICEKHNISVTNYKGVNKVLKDKIEKIKEKVQIEKRTYSWLLHECETERCKENVVKKFLKHLFDYNYHKRS